MADLNIASLGVKMQALIAKFKLDENGDGLINEGTAEASKLSDLLSGKANFKIGIGDQIEISQNNVNQTTMSKQNKVGAPVNPIDLSKAIENYNNLTLEQREEILKLTTMIMQAKLEVLQSKIEQVAKDWDVEVVKPEILYSNNEEITNLFDEASQNNKTFDSLVKEFVESKMSETIDKMQDSIRELSIAFQAYYESGEYESMIDSPYLERIVLQNLGFETQNDLSDAILNLHSQGKLNEAGELLKKYLDEIDNVSKKLMNNEVIETEAKYRSTTLETIKSLQHLEHTKDNGINDYQDIIENVDSLTRKNFEKILIGAYQENPNSIKDITLDNGQKVTVHKPIIETMSNGSKRVVIYNEQGKKFDLSGKAITD